MFFYSFNAKIGVMGAFLVALTVYIIFVEMGYLMEKGLKPIVNNETKVLILGSAPSKKSLELQQYYGNKGNQFWNLIFDILSVTDPIEYSKRVQILLDHHLGLWDVYDTFDRNGSLDSQFQDATLNDFQEIFSLAPIKLIIANGKKAYSESLKNALFREVPILYCPSTSGANNGQKQLRKELWTEALTIN